MIFYKACFEEDLCEGYIPGTITRDIMEAIKWYRRYSSKKKNNFYIQRNGKPVIIKINYNGDLFSHDEFQAKGVKEHEVKNCWTSSEKTKAQINISVDFKILTDSELINYMV